MIMMMMIPIVVTLLGIEIDVSDEHPLKAEGPINCIGLERYNCNSDTVPIVVTLVGIVTDVRPVQ